MEYAECFFTFNDPFSDKRNLFLQIVPFVYEKSRAKLKKKGAVDRR